MANEQPAAKMGRWGRNVMGASCVALLGALLYLVAAILPAGVAEGEATVVLFGGAATMGAEARLFILVALLGALGAGIHMATSFAYFAGKGDLGAGWVWWYVLRPFIGAAVAALLTLVLRGVAFSASAEGTDVNLYGILSFAGLAGMFSKQAVEWMRQIFDQMFRRLTNVEGEPR